VRPTLARCLLLLGVLLALPLSARADAPSWPQLGFDAGHSGVQPDETILSTETVGSLRLAWTTPISGRPTLGEPTVDGGMVFVAANSGRRVGLVTAFDATTGLQRWHRTLDGPTTSAPAIASGLVVTTGGSSVSAFDESRGTPVWSTARPGNDGYRGGSLVAPVVSGDRVYAASDLSEMEVFDLQGGALLGQAPVGLQDSRTPTVSGGTVLVGAQAFDAATLAPEWSAVERGNWWPAVTTPAGDLVGSGSAGGHAVVWDAMSDGTPRWALIVADTDVQLVPQAATSSLVYAVVIGAGDHAVTALKTRKGKPRWTTEIPGAAGLSEANGVVYATAADGLYALDAKRGRVLAHVATDEPLVGQPVVAGGRVYASTAHGIAAFTLAR
jgi:outer membrane protein assembly factor BamB